MSPRREKEKRRRRAVNAWGTCGFNVYSCKNFVYTNICWLRETLRREERVKNVKRERSFECHLSVFICERK